ncbi:MAG: hypothetical protein MJ252_11030 [archaeon]|nr:hypothetical protein [archaeon]
MSAQESEQETKEKVQKQLKDKILFLFNQLNQGCQGENCYNIFCAKNKYSLESKTYFLFLF